MLDKWERNLFTHQEARISADEIDETYDKSKKSKNKLLEKKKILENDLTKALINTIIYSKPARKKFVEILGIKDIIDSKINLFIDMKNKIEKNPKSILLLIKSKYKRDNIKELDKEEEKKEAKEKKKKKDKKDRVIIDALIERKNMNIGIEVKLAANVNLNQIKNEKKELGTKK